MVLNDRIEIADALYECNACWWIRCYLEHNSVDTGMTFTELRAVVKARRNVWCIEEREEMRVYEYSECDEHIPVIGEERNIITERADTDTVYEIPAIAEICKRLKLYP